MLATSGAKALLDHGFSNIGVRPTREDPGRGDELGGFPLSFSRLALAGLTDLLPTGAELPCTPGADCPDKVQVDGAFRVPGLRNVELTGPYFHHGGVGTLQQVVEFYTRGGNFQNPELIDDISEIGSLKGDPAERANLVRFLLTLTDERVKFERAPFDHPQLIIPAGDGLQGVPGPLGFAAGGGSGESESLAA